MGVFRIKDECMKRRRLISILSVIVVFIGLVLWKVAKWVPQSFGDIPFEQVLFHVMVPMKGTDTSVFDQFVSYCLPTPLAISGILLVCFIIKDWKLTCDIKNGEFKHVRNNILIILTTACCLFVYGFGLVDCIYAVGIDDYWYNIKHPSTIYENYYVDPASVTYTFPEKKRNLIYIFLESMETTYEDKENGGAFEESLIPELTLLANQNLAFDNGDKSNNGFLVPAMSGWTAAAMVGQTSGVPLNTPAGANGYLSDTSFLPGAYTLGDILAANGYQNELLLGSDAEFGGREYYFKLHGNYNIVDYKKAIENGWIDKDYRVW